MSKKPAESSWEYSVPKVDSSYTNIGKTFYNLVRELQPELIIEFGVLSGFSTLAMAYALKKNGHGKIVGYDLWDKYQYKHSSMAQTQKTLEDDGVADIVELREGDFDKWKSEPCDILHVDISNTGDTIKALAAKTKAKLTIFEGGSDARDNVEWMNKYNKPKIATCGIPYEVIDQTFPSLSKLI